MPELVIEDGIPKTLNDHFETAKKLTVDQSVKFPSQKEADAFARTLVKIHGPGSFTMRYREEKGEMVWRVWRDQRTVTPRKPRKTAAPVEGAAV